MSHNTFVLATQLFCSVVFDAPRSSHDLSTTCLEQTTELRFINLRTNVTPLKCSERQSSPLYPSGSYLSRHVRLGTPTFPRSGTVPPDKFRTASQITPRPLPSTTPPIHQSHNHSILHSQKCQKVCGIKQMWKRLVRGFKIEPQCM
jgi:hypothetical protein